MSALDPNAGAWDAAVEPATDTATAADPGFISRWLSNLRPPMTRGQSGSGSPLPSPGLEAPPSLLPDGPVASTSRPTSPRPPFAAPSSARDLPATRPLEEHPTLRPTSSSSSIAGASSMTTLGGNRSGKGRFGLSKPLFRRRSGSSRRELGGGQRSPSSGAMSAPLMRASNSNQSGGTLHAMGAGGGPMPSPPTTPLAGEDGKMVTSIDSVLSTPTQLDPQPTSYLPMMTPPDTVEPTHLAALAGLLLSPAVQALAQLTRPSPLASAGVARSDTDTHSIGSSRSASGGNPATTTAPTSVLSTTLDDPSGGLHVSEQMAASALNMPTTAVGALTRVLKGLEYLNAMSSAPPTATASVFDFGALVQAASDVVASTAAQQDVDLVIHHSARTEAGASAIGMSAVYEIGCTADEQAFSVATVAVRQDKGGESS